MGFSPGCRITGDLSEEILFSLYLFPSGNFNEDSREKTSGILDLKIKSDLPNLPDGDSGESIRDKNRGMIYYLWDLF